MDSTVIAIAGALLVIVSAALSGFYSSYLDTAIATKEAEISTLEGGKMTRLEKYNRALNLMSIANLKRTVLLLSETSNDVIVFLKDIHHDIVRAYTELAISGTGTLPEQKEAKTWMEIVKNSLQGDADAANECIKLEEKFHSSFSDNFKITVDEIAIFKEEVDKLKRKNIYYRYLAVAIQILGVIVVLMKDIFQNPN